MVCKECGDRFEEGLLCPKCGTKNAIDSTIYQDYVTKEQDFQKAYNILDEYERIEEEKLIISKLGWPTPKDIEERIRTRLEIYHRAKSLGIKTVGAKQMIEKMKDDIYNDYHEYKGKDSSLGVQIFWAVVFSILAIVFLYPLGIIGIIIAIVVIWAGWSAVGDVIKHKKTIEKIEMILKQDEGQEVQSDVYHENAKQQNNSNYKYCVHCGEQILKTTKFCNFCGKGQ